MSNGKIMLFRALVILFAILISHELGHYIMFELTHEVSGSLHFQYPTGLYFQWPIEADETRSLVAAGGFLATLPFLFVFTKREWTASQAIVIIMLVYGFAEYLASFTDPTGVNNTILQYSLISLIIVTPLLFFNTNRRL